MHVVISGAAGNLARVLLPLLCADHDIGRVSGIDRRPMAFHHAKFRALRGDVGSASAGALLQGADAAIHLAYVLLRGRLSPQEMADTNIRATQSFLGAAAEAGVRRIIFLSSAAVYGAGEFLTEDAPLAPLPGFLYAEHKLACERWLAAEIPRALRLRPHIVLGPHAQPLLKRLADLRFYPSLPEPQPSLQCVHELDVAKAVLLALRGTGEGPFNLAAPDSFTLRELVRARHAGALGLPLPLMRGLLWAAWRFKGWGGEPGWHSGLGRTLTLDCRRATAELGWRPLFTDWRAIVAATFASR